MALVSVFIALVGAFIAIFIPLWVERTKRPVLRIERADDANQRVREPHRRIVHVKIVNRPIEGRVGRWLLRNVATGCKVTLSFTSRSEGTTVHVAGRWSAAPQPLITLVSEGMIGRLYDRERVPQTERFDLSPDDVGEVVAVAIKLEGDAEAYAFASEIYEDPVNFRIPRFRLADEEYTVTVKAVAGGITCSEMFTLHNDGNTCTSLHLRAVIALQS